MSSLTPLQLLIGESEQINPAIILAEEFIRRDATDLLSAEELRRAEEIMQRGRAEIEITKKQISAFVRSAPSPSACLPLGF